ncbi:BlaI/MecI/CopY family transcriptional regulator [Marinimicrococcus flavescens]|uniref:BlaI/MecI/CopY family transcriptional regulator n=1 Tax=Marinimicrococcus flavescens TaxID=3031815 RepID=A0AAP3V065_9PROT|nr:BlaI/MecI/CopY family transcriptional regulator [Marinimicrococcus flavescens]
MFAEEDRETTARETVQRKVLECLNRFYAIETGMWGDPVSCLMIRTIIKGRIEGRLYDVSSLATYLDLSLATVHRKLKRIEERGYVERRREGRSVRLWPTARVEEILDLNFDQMIETLRRLYKGG